jgi:hypothetical protein
MVRSGSYDGEMICTQFFLRAFTKVPRSDDNLYYFEFKDQEIR